MKKYAYLQLCIYSVSLLAITSLGIYLQPLSGDLTRIGGFSENNFRPFENQQILAKTLSDFDNYDQYYDVVILGDSFSQSRSYGWQQWLAMRSSLSVTTLHINKWSISKLIEHPVFINTPPQLVIFETAERNMEKRLARNEKSSCSEFSKTSIFNKVIVNPDKQKLLTVLPAEKTFNIDYEQAVSFFRANYRSHIQNKPRTISLELENTNLFSNNKSNAILVLKKDFKKLKWPADILDKSLCTLKNFQHNVQKNGTTWFVSMIAPDKLTAYLPYINSDKNLPNTFLNKMHEDEELQIVDLLTPIKNALEREEKDIYSPNDSHWSSRGHKLVADSLLAYLVKNNIVFDKNKD